MCIVMVHLELQCALLHSRLMRAYWVFIFGVELKRTVTYAVRIVNAVDDPFFLFQLVQIFAMGVMAIMSIYGYSVPAELVSELYFPPMKDFNESSQHAGEEGNPFYKTWLSWFHPNLKNSPILESYSTITKSSVDWGSFSHNYDEISDVSTTGLYSDQSQSNFLDVLPTPENKSILDYSTTTTPRRLSTSQSHLSLSIPSWKIVNKESDNGKRKSRVKHVKYTIVIITEFGKWTVQRYVMYSYKLFYSHLIFSSFLAVTVSFANLPKK